MKLKLFSFLFCTVCLVSIGIAQLNVGSLTHLKVFQSKIYVAGTTGVACLKSPTEVEWQLTLPNADNRLMEVDENGVVFVTYDYDGIEKKGGFWLNRLGDVKSFSNATMGSITSDGKLAWSQESTAQAKQSIPGIDKNVVAVLRLNTMSISDRATGKEIAVVEVCANNGLIKGMVSQITPNQPLLQNGFIYSCAFNMLKKIDYTGKIIEDTKSFGMMKPFECITYGPVLVKDVMVFGNIASGSSKSRVFAANDKLKDEWSEFIDKESGSGSMFVNGDMVFVSSNFVLAAYNYKGKNLWTNDEVRLSAMRGLRYHSTFGVRKTSNNYLTADNNYVYLASQVKVKKKEVGKDNITVFDIKKGKEVSVIEMGENELLIDMQLWNNSILLLTSNGLKQVNKPA
ncbi:MAG: hypothetical protein JWQ09_5250 [Segetibacter sp.]|nr:hypothetical protein [Segetibacter sp.]